MPALTDIKQGLAQLLLSDGNIGGMISQRVFFSVVPQNAVYPCICIIQISRETFAHLQGVSGAALTWLQVDSYGNSDKEATDLDELVRLAILPVPSPAMGGIVVHETTDVNSRDVPIPPKDGSQQWRHCRQHDFTIIHDQAIPVRR